MKIEVNDKHVVQLLTLDRVMEQRGPDLRAVTADPRQAAGELHGLLIDLEVTLAQRRPNPRWIERKLVAIAACALLAAGQVKTTKPQKGDRR